MLRRTLLGTGLAAGAASPLAAPAVLRAQEVKRWRMVTSWPKNLPGPGVSAERVAERIGRLSGGRLQVEVFGAGELVPALEVMDAVGDGVAEMGHTAAVFWMGKRKVSALFLAVPFGLTPGEHGAWIEHGGGQALWDELYGDFGVKPFMAGNTGMSMGGWFRDELHSAKDLKGLRFRMPGLGGELYGALGIVQVSMAPGETLQALQAGTIDAAEFAGPSSDLALGFHEAASFYYWPGLHEPNGTGEAIVALDEWHALDDELRAIVEHACAAEHAFALAESERRNAEALAKLTGELGVTLKRFPRDIEEAAARAADDVLDQFADMGNLESRIHGSYRAALQRGAQWPTVSIQAFLEARNRAS